MRVPKPKWGSAIPDFTFQHVARGVVESAKGIVGSILAAITVDVPAAFEKRITVPVPKKGTALVPDNLELVAMIIDWNTGTVVNADKVALGDPSSIASPKEIDILKYTVADGCCTVTLPGHVDGKVKVELIDPDGKVVVGVNAVGGGSEQITYLFMP